jgi:hypothetical protein
LAGWSDDDEEYQNNDSGCRQTARCSFLHRHTPTKAQMSLRQFVSRA